MTTHTIATREQWLAERVKLLDAEKDLVRRSDEVAAQRQALPWVPVEKDYRFATEAGEASLADLFAGRSQLLIYHFMFGPDYAAGCPACSAIADGFDRSHVHLANHDVTLMAVSRAPLPRLLDYRERMGWSFPWASSAEDDFNYDMRASFTEQQQRTGDGDYNYAPRAGMVATDVGPDHPAATAATLSGTDVATYLREAPGVSSFVLQDGVVHHAYSTYARGLDGLWGMYQWLDRAPLGRNETGWWFQRRDEYGGSAAA
jgi:predicted dithiol-disulfide oxidoreductase (DUF899 family)